jgi:Zn finger protein HypA/HybF involved in hydrogenase expression
MSSGGQNKLSEEQVFEQLRAVHGDAFDYTNSVYRGTNVPMEVYCKKHDFTFFPTPKNHKNGSKCKHCGREAQIEKAKKPQKDFETEVTDLYGDKYGFNLTNYVNTSTHVTLICDIHGEFTKSPSSILNGNACDECCKNKTRSTDKGIFIEEAVKVYGDKDDYTNTEVISSKFKVEVRCTKHDFTFKKDIQSYLLGCGCPKCSAENYSLVRTKTTEKYLEEAKNIHNDRFDYTDTLYKSATQPLNVRCKKHNEIFECIPDNHLKVQSGGCKKCHSEEMSAMYMGREGTGGYTRSGYITQAKGREAKVYLIECWDEHETFYKIGKTFLDLSERFKGKKSMPYNFKEIDFHKGDAGYIYDLEVELHRKYKEYKYKPEFWFGGHTECYTKNLPIDDIWEMK